MNSNILSKTISLSAIVACVFFGISCFAEDEMARLDEKNTFTIQLMNDLDLNDNIDNLSLKSVGYSDSSKFKHKRLIYEFDSDINIFEIRNMIRDMVQIIAKNNNLTIDRSSATLNPATIGWSFQINNIYNITNLVILNENDSNKYTVAMFVSLVPTASNQ